MTSVPDDHRQGASGARVTQELGIELWRFHHTLRATLDAALADGGLSFAEYCVLELVHHQPEVTAARLAEQVFVSRQALGRTIARLTEAELLHGVAGPGPARPLRTTTEGEALLQTLQASVLAAHDRLFTPLTSDERQLVMTLIRRCSDGQSATRGPIAADASG